MRSIIALASQTLRRRRSAFLVSLVTLFGMTDGAEAASQTIQLKQGGNYIGFTLAPADAAPAVIFGSLGDAFVQASSLDNVSKKWTFYRNRNKSPNPADVDTTNSIDPMPNVAMGRGYYVEMSSAATLTVNGTSPTSIQPITLQPGQNFVCPVIPGLTSPISLSDLLNGPDYQFSSAHLLNGALHVQFTNNDSADDTVSSVQPGEALIIESKLAVPFTFTPALLNPPRIFFDRSTPFVVESPMAGAGGTASVDLPIRITRPFTSSISVRFGMAGTARFSADYAFPSLSPIPTANVGSFNVSGGATSLNLSVSITQRQTIQANTSAILSLRRPAEPGVTDSATLPQIVEVKITDGINGVYEGVLKNQTTSSPFEAQGIRVALRGNGIAVCEPAEGSAISSRFSLPYTITAGIPQLSSNVVVNLSSQAALGRAVTMRVQPGVTIALPQGAGLPPGYEIPMSLTLYNLVASGPIQIAATLTLSQVNPALSNP